MSTEESEDPGSLELEARYKMYTKIQQYQDNLVFPSLPLGASDSASSTSSYFSSSTSSSSSSSSSASYATSFSSRRSTSAAAATAVTATAAATAAVKVKEQPNKASVTSLSIEAQNVLRSLLQRDPLLRLSAKNVLLSDWLCES